MSARVILTVDGVLISAVMGRDNAGPIFERQLQSGDIVRDPNKTI